MKKIIKNYLPYVVIILTVILIRSFLITPVTVDGTSMDNTLKDGQILMLNKVDSNYSRFDIVVFNYNGERLIKRVIGLPGDIVYMKENKLYINEIEVEDIYASTVTGDFIEEELKENEYYLLGDNRINSFDCRYFGPIKKEDIIGSVTFRIFPFSKMGKV